MKVTEEEMELLKVVLNGLTSTGPAIQLVNLWRQRGVEPSEFELETKEKIPLALSSPSPPSLSLHSLSSSVTPSLTITPAKESPLLKETKESLVKKKRKLSVDLVLGTVPPDLTLQSPAFLKTWRQWIENRLELGKSTLRSFELHMATCGRLGESRAIAAINHSIASSYLSIYEPKSTKLEKQSTKYGPTSC
jgi:hypothetical protein